MGYSFQCWFSEHHNRLVPQMFIFRASSIDFPRHLLGWVCICTFVCARVLPSESGITIRFPPYCSCISAPLPLMAWSEHNGTQCYQPSHALTDGCVSPTTASLQYYTHTHQHLQGDWLHALLALHCQCLLFLSLCRPTIHYRDLFHMRPCPIVATIEQKGCWRKWGGGEWE